MALNLKLCKQCQQAGTSQCLPAYGQENLSQQSGFSLLNYQIGLFIFAQVFSGGCFTATSSCTYLKHGKVN